MKLKVELHPVGSKIKFEKYGGILEGTVKSVLIDKYGLQYNVENCITNKGSAIYGTYLVHSLHILEE